MIKGGKINDFFFPEDSLFCTGGLGLLPFPFPITCTFWSSLRLNHIFQMKN